MFSFQRNKTQKMKWSHVYTTITRGLTIKHLSSRPTIEHYIAAQHMLHDRTNTKVQMSLTSLDQPDQSSAGLSGSSISIKHLNLNLNINCSLRSSLWSPLQCTRPLQQRSDAHVSTHTWSQIYTVITYTVYWALLYISKKPNIRNSAQ